MVEGRSKQCSSGSPPGLRSGRAGSGGRVDGFSGFKTAAAEKLPDAVSDGPVRRPPRGDALDRTRQRVRQDTLGHRGPRRRPALRSPPHPTGASFLTEADRAARRSFAVESTSRSKPGHLPAHRRGTANPTKQAKEMMQAVIDSVSNGVPALLKEVRRLGHAEAARRGHPRVLRPPRNEQLAQRRPSTVSSSTFTVPPSASGTSRTTSPDRSSK